MTVGSGIEPDLLTLDGQAIQALAGSAAATKLAVTLPPVGNFTPP